MPKVKPYFEKIRNQNGSWSYYLRCECDALVRLNVSDDLDREVHGMRYQRGAYSFQGEKDYRRRKEDG